MVRSAHEGFTIVELLISTTVFSFILLIATSAVLQISRVYQKGVTTAKTQETARAIMEDISRTIQFEGGPLTGPFGGPTQFYFCIGTGKTYTYLIDRQLKDNPNVALNQRRNVLAVRNTGGCVPQALEGNAAATPDSQELMAPHMRLSRLSVQLIPGTTNLYEVQVRVVYGDNDVLNPTRSGCGNFRLGGQFCASSELKTVVQKRVQ